MQIVTEIPASKVEASKLPYKLRYRYDRWMVRRKLVDLGLSTQKEDYSYTVHDQGRFFTYKRILVYRTKIVILILKRAG